MSNPLVLDLLQTALADRRHFAPDRMAENELLDAIGMVRELLAAAQQATAECVDLIRTPAGDALTAAIAKANGGAA